MFLWDHRRVSRYITTDSSQSHHTAVVKPSKVVAMELHHDVRGTIPAKADLRGQYRQWRRAHTQ